MVFGEQRNVVNASIVTTHVEIDVPKPTVLISWGTYKPCSVTTHLSHGMGREVSFQTSEDPGRTSRSATRNRRCAPVRF